MKTLDYIILMAVLTALILSIKKVIKRKGACSGDCANCHKNCK